MTHDRILRAARFASALVTASFAAALFPAAVHAGSGDDDSAESDSRVKRGYEILPPGVHLHLAGKNRALVGIGSYIVNSAGCIDCHTHPTYQPNGDPFKGQQEAVNSQQYMSGGRMFGPFLTSANLTPDSSGKPAGLTRSQFVETLRTGRNPNDVPPHILQVMPWPAYGKMTERDLHAVYEFLRTLPSLPDNPKPGP